MDLATAGLVALLVVGVVAAALGARYLLATPAAQERVGSEENPDSEERSARSRWLFDSDGGVGGGW